MGLAHIRNLIYIVCGLIILSACLPVKVPPQNYSNIHNAIKKTQFYPSIRSTYRPRNKNNLNINIKGSVELAITLKGDDPIFEGYELGWCGKQNYKKPAISNQYSESIQKIDCNTNAEKQRISQQINTRLAKLVRNIKKLGINGLVKESGDIYIWVYLPVIEITEKYLVDFEDPNQVIATPLDDTGMELVISRSDIKVIGKIKKDRVPQAIIMIPKTFHTKPDIDWNTISEKKIISTFSHVKRVKVKKRYQYGQPIKLPDHYLKNIFLMTIK